MNSLRAERQNVTEEEVSEMLETDATKLKVFPGHAHPLGVSEVETGINFAIFSRHATAVTLCLILPERLGDMFELALDPQENRTGDIWHVGIEDLHRSNVRYGYRVDGHQDWRAGHRYDSNIVLIDPYAKLIEGRRMFGDVSNKMQQSLGTYDLDSLPFDWGEDYKLPSIPAVNCVSRSHLPYRTTYVPACLFLCYFVSASQYKAYVFYI